MTTETQNAAATGTTPEASASAATTPSANEFSSFLGVEASELPSLRPVQNPEPAGTESSATETASEPELEAGSEAEQAETQETAALDDEAQPEQEALTDDDDNWLPQEQAKEFPEAALQEYASRRGYKWDPHDESQMRLLRDKLNTDIYVAQLRQDLENQNLEGTTPQEAGDQPELAATETAASTDPRADYYQQVDAVVAQIDKQATEEFGRQLIDAFGVDTDPKLLQQLQNQMRNPQTTPAQRADIQSHLDMVQNAGKIGSVMTSKAVDLMMTALPVILPQILEAVAPGLLPAYQGWQQTQNDVRVASTTWEQVRKATNGRGQPLYSNLPAYNTPEFKALTTGAESKLGLPKGSLGEMSAKGLTREAYVLVAKAASGQQIAPAIVQRAVTAGRQQERTQNQRRAVGRALGAGATSQQFEQEPEADPVKTALHAAIREQNGANRPFGNV